MMLRYSDDQGYQAFRVLQVAFILVLIVAGVDKFFNLLTIPKQLHKLVFDGVGQPPPLSPDPYLLLSAFSLGKLSQKYA
jgi:hypothetical protein